MTSTTSTLRMTEFIRDNVLLPRLKKHGCLVLYDAAGRYRELCHELAGEKCLVVDTSESSLEGREAAMQGLRKVGNRDDVAEMLLVYVPARPPVTSEEQQADPFSVYAAAGGVFPDGDADDFLALCLRARPDHATEVRRIFESDAHPSFAAVDAIGTGAGWPQLRSSLKAESVRDILLAILAPQDGQGKKLIDTDTWVDELKTLCQAALGLEFKTRARRYAPLAEELWRFLLFSDLALAQAELPASLAGVPRAPQAARSLVEDLCDQLRSDVRTQLLYVQRAREVEAEFQLPTHFVNVHHLVHRGTFRFQERAALRQAVQALEADQYDKASGILATQTGSIWSTGEESRIQWAFLAASLNLIRRCEEVEPEVVKHTTSFSSLIDFYTGTLRDVDRLQRELDQAQPDILVHDPDELMVGVGKKARSVYRKLIERVQAIFMRHFEADGWPVPRFLANAHVFERFLAPRLQESGRRVAFILVDALRYELGVELSKQLADDGPVELHAACASLPSITQVGMASLLPSAGSDLCLSLLGDALTPMLGETPVRTVPERMEVFSRRYGDRFAEMTLSDFLKPQTPKVPATVNLLVLRTQDIDSQLENNPDSTLHLVPRELTRIRAALHRLGSQGFVEAVIATDHGFFLNTQAGPGDVCAKPNGTWGYEKDRSLLGHGTSDTRNAVLPTDKVGIRGVAGSYACPRSLAPYRSGLRYFHSGASLQELIVPVLIARLTPAEPASETGATVVLSYRLKSGKVTSRLVTVDVSVEGQGLFSTRPTVEFLIDAQDAKGNIVGEVKPGEGINPATGTMSLEVGQQARVTLKMHGDFEGAFKVKAVQPTTLVEYASLSLKTDYAV